MIRARIRAVSGSCIIVSFVVLWIIIETGELSLGAAMSLLGWWPVSLADIGRSVLLTAILFLGPLYERGVVEGEWQSWLQLHNLRESLGDWIEWRNYVAVSSDSTVLRHIILLCMLKTLQGPFTEEVMFRSAIIPLHILARVSPGHIVFITPLYFGIAHIHHFYEFRLTHPDTPISVALLRPIFQFGYTTIFGWYASFIYLRTGSLWAAFLVHSFCNWNGLPRFWGRIEVEPRFGKAGHGTLHIGWTAVYYLLLLIGALSFAQLLWPLTESYHALVSFSASSSKH